MIPMASRSIRYHPLNRATGGSATQTIVVFVNRAVGTERSVESSLASTTEGASQALGSLWRDVLEFVLGGNSRLELQAMSWSLVS